jgi:hypothetical protein
MGTSGADRGDAVSNLRRQAAARSPAAYASVISFPAADRVSEATTARIALGVNSGRAAGYAPARLDTMRAAVYRSRRLPPSGTGTRRLQPGSLCGGCVAGNGSRQSMQRQVPICRHFESGSDGTRTRDLRRDRPIRSQRPPTTNPSELPHLQGLFGSRLSSSRMVA